MDNKKEIEKIIKKSSQGLTIQEIVNQSKLSWNTVTKILAMIEGEGNITIRKVSRAKLHYWKNTKGGEKK